MSETILKNDLLTDVMMRILEVDTVTPDMSVDTTPSWNSFRHIQLMSELERTFGVRFEFYEIAEMTNVKLIKNALQIKTGE